MLRSYDSRFRQTNRSPVIYLSPECRNIVGKNVTKVLQLPEEDATADANEFDSLGVTNSSTYDYSFWNKSKGRTLLVIATPYRHGSHVADKPKAFLPLISQLEELHEKGFVHGDIRAFNTVFGKDEDEGWLIDFDFGGKQSQSKYPKGYRPCLYDGDRIRDAENESEILKWHDWYALGRLIFHIHRLRPPDRQDEEWWKSNIFTMERIWGERNRDPTPEEITELKDFLCRFQDEGGTVYPNPNFRSELQTTGLYSQRATNLGATGSPPERKG